MNYINYITALLSCLLSIFAVATIFSKSGRGIIKKLFKKNTKFLKETNDQQNGDIQEIRLTLASLGEQNELLQKQVMNLQESAKQELRNEIKNIYYKYVTERKLPLYERETADVVYKLYSQEFDGNSYASLLYTEICKWEIDCKFDMVIN